MGAIKREEYIGGQRLILGDCMEVMPLLGRVDAVVTDPPYSSAYQAKWGSVTRKDGVKMDAALSFDGIDRLLDTLPSAIAEKCAGWGIFFTNIEGVHAWLEGLAAWKPDNVLAWVKPDCTPRLNGEGPARGFEPAVTCWFGKGRRKWNAGGKRGIYTCNVNSGRFGGHPTEKPVNLMIELIKDFASPTGDILDPFMGSGTTLVACQRMGRQGTGIELDPEYFEIACKRVDEATRQVDMFTAQPETQKPEQGSMF